MMIMKQKKNIKTKEIEMDELKKEKKAPFIWCILTFFITIAGVFGIEYLFGKEMSQWIRDCVFAGTGALIINFLLLQNYYNNAYDYDNKEHVGRFFFCYILSYIVAIVCSFLPITGWPFIVVFVLLSLFSNTLTGIVSSSVLLIIGLLISGIGFQGFFIYFLSGVTAACLFSRLDENFKVGVPIFLSLILLMVCETAGSVILVNEKLHFNLFVIPLINLVMTAILLVVILKFFSYFVIYKYRDKYMEINDPECILLVELKEKSKDAYYKAVHTAYFCDRVSKKLGLDSNQVKACGYYHKIGQLKGKDQWENVLEIGKEHGFPPSVLQILKEYICKDTPITHKETAVVMFSDTVVSSILYLFSKDTKAELDYNHVIETIFKKKIDSGILKECSITFEEIEIMKTIFKQEKLYYDFLR